MRKGCILFVLISLCGWSCRKGDLESQPVEVINPYVKPRQVDFITFKASVENYESKATLDLSGSGKVVWEKGDRVLICCEDKEALYEALSGGKDTTTLVRVSGDTLSRDNGQVFTAWYPADSKEAGVPSRLSYSDPSVLSSVPMTASGSKNLNFENRFGVVRCSYKPERDLLVKYIRFSAATPLCAQGPVLLDCTGFSPLGINLYAGKECSFALFAQAGGYSSFRTELLSDLDAAAMVDITLEYDLEVSRNQMAEVNLNLPGGSGANLSKNGTANCYTIKDAGEYWFKPTRGCSEEVISGIATVELVWEMDNQGTAPATSVFSALSYVPGKIQFQTTDPFKTGNALIAAKDAAGTVLWSWHIWAVENAIADYPYDSAGKYLLMDRSLGALAGTRSSSPSDNKYASSLLYQWGRKDPFPGQTTQGDRPLIAVNGTARSLEIAPVTLSQSVQNPTVFYVGGGNWCVEDGEAQWNADTKSLYDPCPPGYIVPPMEVFTEAADIFYVNFTGSGCVSRGGSYIFPLNGKYYCWPLSAWFNGSTGAKEEKGTNVMWTTRSQENTASACYMWYSTPPGGSKKAPLADPDHQMPKTSGASVRCMKIQE